VPRSYYHGQSTRTNVSKVNRAQELLLTHQPANATTEPAAVPDSSSGKTDLSFPGSCYYHKSWNQHQAEVTKNKITAGTFFHHPGRNSGTWQSRAPEVFQGRTNKQEARLEKPELKTRNTMNLPSHLAIHLGQ
jgi:hypothetical protein